MTVEVGVGLLTTGDRLVDERLGELYLTEASGYVVTALDLGYPSVRAVSSSRVNAHGEDDLTRFYGARAVSLSIGVFASAERPLRETLDRLRAFASPAARPVLYFAHDGIERRLRLRGASFSGALTNPRVVEAQVQWVAPDGIIESSSATTTQVRAYANDVRGLSFPLSFDVRFDSISAEGSTTVLNQGTEPAAPVLQLWGPCTGPELTNLDTGELVSFPALTLTAEQYVEINVREATIRLNGRAAESLYSQLDFTRSSLWWLKAGENRLRYRPTSYSADATAVVLHHSAWL